MQPPGIMNEFSPLWDDIVHADTFPQKRPLLAHYTSISTLECIMRNDAIWFSNPLYMNDLEELRYGLTEGQKAFMESEELEDACGTPERYHAIKTAFNMLFDDFGNRHAFDTYVFCLSEHNKLNTDGLLSMWRGYGQNGAGAALVIDSAKFEHIENSPLIISNVVYATAKERKDWITGKVRQFSEIIRNTRLSLIELDVAAQLFFERIKIFSLFTKHQGFSEEKEWRVVYQRQRDVNNVMSNMLDYAITKNGVEPKLKFKVAPIKGVTKDDLSLDKIVSHIILGPSISSPLAQASVKRMLERVGKQNISTRIYASTTPFRPN